MSILIRLTSEDVGRITTSLKQRAQSLRDNFRGLEREAEELEELIERIQVIQWNVDGE